MFPLPCSHCHGTHNHVVTNQIVGAKYIDLDTICTNCEATTSTRYATNTLYSVTNEPVKKVVGYIPSEEDLVNAEGVH